MRPPQDKTKLYLDTSCRRERPGGERIVMIRLQAHASRGEGCQVMPACRIRTEWYILCSYVPSLMMLQAHAKIWEKAAKTCLPVPIRTEWYYVQ